MNFEDLCDGEAPELDIQTIQAIAALCSSLNCQEGRISSDIIQTVINAITSQVLTPNKQAIVEFTPCKLKNMDTQKNWIAGKHKYLNQFHDLQLFGKAILWLTKQSLLY